MKGKEGIEGSGHTTNYAFSRPLYVMLKPAGSQCNLRCSYCYYLEKGRLYQTATGHTMSDELLEKFIRQYMEAQTMPEVLFTWHGGEPLLCPIDFYRRALQLQRIYGRGRPVANCIQTNGTLLSGAVSSVKTISSWASPSTAHSPSTTATDILPADSRCSSKSCEASNC